jgi:hypothetical protein
MGVATIRASVVNANTGETMQFNYRGALMEYSDMHKDAWRNLNFKDGWLMQSSPSHPTMPNETFVYIGETEIRVQPGSFKVLY